MPRALGVISELHIMMVHKLCAQEWHTCTSVLWNFALAESKVLQLVPITCLLSEVPLITAMPIHAAILAAMVRMQSLYEVAVSVKAIWEVENMCVVGV